MRTPEEIQNEIHRLQEERKAVDAKLYEEFSQARAHKIAQLAAADAEAGRTNSCRPSFGDKQTAWETRDDGWLHCTYCGSLHPEEAVKLLQTEGTAYSGSDWKYGNPHKYYIGNSKFYNRHLADASPEIFEEFAALSLRYFGIGWEKHDGKIFYNSPPSGSFYGHQQWGEVGKTTCPCGCVGGRARGYCICAADPKCHPDPTFPVTR